MNISEATLIRPVDTQTKTHTQTPTYIHTHSETQHQVFLIALGDAAALTQCPIVPARLVPVSSCESVTHIRPHSDYHKSLNYCVQ